MLHKLFVEATRRNLILQHPFEKWYSTCSRYLVLVLGEHRTLQYFELWGVGSGELRQPDAFEDQTYTPYSIPDRQPATGAIPSERGALLLSPTSEIAFPGLLLLPVDRRHTSIEV